ncbi:hypothetical protein [Magnetospira sp. QH-2]|uniref:hypothetical protein n=1 Tax=Magnetospira sp. (strain QH-2) TaxID=1288970 RepID=UPI00130E3560|nr:hypothetical protein [Magnetospira sp. QH-2]
MIGALLLSDLARADTRAWVVQTLNAELNKTDPDYNVLASLTFPLTAGFHQHQSEAGHVLDRVYQYLGGLHSNPPGCAKLPDVLLMAGFLAPTGRKVETDWAEAAFRQCATGTQPFDTANALIFFCRYTQEDHDRRVPGGVARLLERQRLDGAFVDDKKQLDFYLTTHAVLALHDCRAASEEMKKGAAWMVRALPDMARAGFLDGLAESLIFLDWMRVPVREKARILDWLRRQVRSDGGLCFVGEDNCRSHWHATSLLLYLLDHSRP